MKNTLNENNINYIDIDYFNNILNVYQKLHNISDLNIFEVNNKKYLVFAVDRYLVNQGNIQYFKEIYLYNDNNIRQITFNFIDKNLKIIGNKLFFVRDLKNLKEKDLNWGIFYFDLEFPFEAVNIITDKEIKANFDNDLFNEYNLNLIDYKFLNNKLFLILRKSLTKSKYKLQENNLNQVRFIQDIFYRHDSFNYLDSFDVLFIK